MVAFFTSLFLLYKLIMLSRSKYNFVSLLCICFLTISVTGGINDSYSGYVNSTEQNIHCRHDKALERIMKQCGSNCCLVVGYCMNDKYSEKGDNMQEFSPVCSLPYTRYLNY